MNYIIGCGGVGSWLVPKLYKLTKNIFLVDGDSLEEKNLDRQLFNSDDIGEFKAYSLAYKYGIGRENVRPEYYSLGMFDVNPTDVLWCCADNHACRREVLYTCDRYNCCAVIGANEYTDAEAYWYEPNWLDSHNDPRVFYPDILTDRSGDPLAPRGCTGAAAVARPQLVLANDWASGLMLHLWWFHTHERPRLEPDTEPYWPVLHRCSATRWSTIRKDDRKPTE